ncbi:MAG: hypothetical protein ACRD1Q_09415 [Vicinamibacterales bacterium]
MMRIHVGALLVALVVVAPTARATTFAAADFSELVLAARAIAHGRVIDVQPQLSDGRRRVETLVTLQVATYLKGSLGSTVVFRVPGGQLGRYRTIILDAPNFVPGDEVVLLLGSRGPSVPYVLGLSQGVYRVTGDPISGERRVMPTPVRGEGNEWTRVVRGDSSRRPILLTDFASSVQAILRGQP